MSSRLVTGTFQYDWHRDLQNGDLLDLYWFGACYGYEFSRFVYWSLLDAYFQFATTMTTGRAPASLGLWY